MKLKQQFQQLLKGKSCQCIEVVDKGSLDLHYYRVELKQNKQQLELTSKADSNELETLGLSSKLPAVLVLEGISVLSKIVEGNVSLEVEHLYSKLLPGANSEEFYLQYVTLSNDRLWLAMMRKDTVHQLIEKIEEAGVHVVNVCIGQPVVSAALSLINKEAIHYHGYTLTHQNGGLIDWKPSDTAQSQLQIGGDSYEADYLPGFSGAFNFLLEVIPVYGDVNIATTGEQIFHQKRIFELGKWAAMILVLLMSLGNYLVFDHYYKAYNEMDARVAQHASEAMVIDRLQEELEYKKKLLEESGLLAPSKTSYYSDNIAATVTRPIVLEEMEIFPSSKSKKSGEVIYSYKDKTIKIVGWTNNSQELNDWIGKLKQMNWVNSVEIKRYEKSNKRKESQFELTLTINAG